MPGADAPRQIIGWKRRGHTVTSGIPHAVFIRLLRDLPGDDCATVACGTDRKLDTSFKDIRTARLDRPPPARPSRAPPASTAAHPTFVTFAKRPS